MEYVLTERFHKMHSRNTLETREKSDADQKTQMSRNSFIMIIRLEFKETFLILRVIHADDSTGKGREITLQMIKFQKNNRRKYKYNNFMTQFASFSIFLFFFINKQDTLIILILL